MAKSAAIFPTWVKTVGAMKQAQHESQACAVRVACTRCSEWREVDLDAVIAAKGPDFSLVNKHYRCRLTEGCEGLNRFSYEHGCMRPLWDYDTADRWFDR